MESDVVNRFVESLQTDLKTLSTETRKRYPPIREACEEALNRLRSVTSNPQPLLAVKGILNQVLYPIIQGSETKDPKLVKICLSAMQKLITQEVLDEKSACFITNTLWLLMENGVEEVKVLQTTALLLTISDLVRGEGLAKCVVLCFRLHFSKDPTVASIAGATVRQLVSLVFERVIAEDGTSPADDIPSSPESESNPGKNLKPFAHDAYSLFLDLVLLVNAEQPLWLLGMTEMTRTFGIELLELILSSFHSVFYKHKEFVTLLKDRVCALVIKLFSPNVKSQHRYNSGSTATSPAGSQQQQQAAPLDKPFFPISMRLLRLVSVLIQKYYTLLVTECEIFLSLVIKFLDPDKPTWQRALALEILHRLLAQPSLVKSFCESYDMKPHATNIFQDTVNSLAACIQSLFVTSSTAPPNATQTAGTATMIGGVPAGPGISPQAGFLYRGSWIPICATFSSGQPKATYLDLLDKSEPPPIPEGYCMSVAYFCLLDIVRSLSLITDNAACDGSPSSQQSTDLTEENLLHSQLVNSSWCGLLAALTLLLDASTDETSTENVLKALQTCAHISGRASLNTPRDAFITALCKASLPPHYTLTVLNAVPVGTVASRVHSRQPSMDGYGSGQHNSSSGSETEFRQHLVVAVGSPLPMPSVPAGSQQGPVVLTAKNLQCMRAVLSVAHCHGSILGSAWHLVLTTLQHLAWILGLKPSSGGSLKSARPALDASTAALVPSTSAVLADLPVLSSMLSRLFESSQYLDGVALHHLIDALCQLSQEAMEVAYSNREPSLFAVAKLLETGLVNLGRVEILWRPVTNHLLEVCVHPATRMREWGVESITTLVKAAVQYQHHNPPLKDNKKLQTLLLSPLAELSSTSHADVRQKQVDCVLHLLNSSGDVLSYGWPLILNMIGAISNTQGENLIRLAFQCLQLVVTDYLPVLPARCLPLAVETTGKFGSQTQELNVSLTAIGLMWNVSDYFYQNRETLQKWLSEEKAKVFPSFPGIANMEAFDKLWMCLYTKLGELCIDSRPAVRKSAGQTLFTTITAHGDLLQHSTWQAVLWQVLFPLLEKVKTFSSQASDEKVDTSGSILIHHSRNTAQKQWAETQVLTLSGVARVFHAKRSLLQNLGDFSRAWALLLEFIENSALNRNSEVSLAALKAFQDVLSPQTKTSSSVENDEMMWNLAWKIWLAIGSQSTTPPTETKGIYLPSQPFLTALVLIFPGLFHHIKARFVSSDLQSLCSVLQSAACVPVHGEASPFVLASMNESILTPLQEGVLLCLDTVQKELVAGNELTQSMLPLLFTQLLTFAKYSCQTPAFGKLEARPISTIKASQVEWVSVNYVPFGEKCLTMAIHLFDQCCQVPSVINAHVFTHIIHCLRLPLSLKYDCTSQSTWRLAVHSLVRVLKTGLPVACKFPDAFQNLWSEISNAFDEFLFPKSVTPSNQTPEEAQADESLDCMVVELIREEILPQAANYPAQFVLRLMALLNKGSIHSVDPDTELKNKLREEFSKICFETLLRFSVLHEEAKTGEPAASGEKTNLLAITSLLHRFKEVLEKFVEDEKLSGKCPLPRYRVSELSFTLQSLTTLTSSLKKIAPSKVNPMSWQQLIGLYPSLVELTSLPLPAVGRTLRDALMEYADLLQSPVNITAVANGN